MSIAQSAPAFDLAHGPPEDPRCPNCSCHMTLVRHLPRLNEEEQVNVFQCRSCRVFLTSEDHISISGTKPAASVGGPD